MILDLSNKPRLMETEVKKLEDESILTKSKKEK